MSNTTNNTLFWAGFLAILTAGVGFSVRGAILGDWGNQFGFTQSELGTITGGDLVGFGITIIALSAVADRVGYGRIMGLAFFLHVSSAFVTLAATPVFHAFGKDDAYLCLYWGTFLFALGNGACEAVANPLTATIFPKEKTRWLNILHAGWPAGLLLGATISLILGAFKARWEIQMAMFLVPALGYGILMMGKKFPLSEAHIAGITVGTMLLEFASPILIILLILYAMVGYVELGTDSWISNITGHILANKKIGIMLFIWTSGLMFILRFFAGPIVHKVSPLGLLFVGSILVCCGLLMLGQANTALMCVVAATAYSLGATFLWPTMLGVVAERFLRGGALTLGVAGGIGMLSAGLLGGPGIGYKQDYFASHYLQELSPASYQRYKSDSEKGFLFFPKISGLGGSKVATLEDNGQQLHNDIDIMAKTGRLLSDDKNLSALNSWWQSASEHIKEDEKPVKEANLYGGRMALTLTAAVPATMALGYMFLSLYFRRRGGYKVEHIV